MMVPNTPHPPFLAGGGGGIGSGGSTGMLSPIAWPALYTLKVVALLWKLLTLFGTVSTWPSIRMSLPTRPLASAIRYHRLSSPQTARAIEASVSPWRTVEALASSS